MIKWNHMLLVCGNSICVENNRSTYFKMCIHIQYRTIGKNRRTSVKRLQIEPFTSQTDLGFQTEPYKLKDIQSKTFFKGFL